MSMTFHSHSFATRFTRYPESGYPDFSYPLLSCLLVHTLQPCDQLLCKAFT